MLCFFKNVPAHSRWGHCFCHVCVGISDFQVQVLSQNVVVQCVKYSKHESALLKAVWYCEIQSYCESVYWMQFFWFFFLLKFEASTVTARVPPLAWMICALDLGHWASKGNFVCESHPSGWTRLVSTVMRLRCWDKIAQYATTCTWNNLSPDKVIFEWHIWYLVSIPVCKLQLQFGSYVLVCIVWGV